MRALGPIVAILAVLALLVSSSLFTVDQRQNAIVFQLGEVKEVINRSGLHFKWPLLQNVRHFDMRILSLREHVRAGVQIVRAAVAAARRDEVGEVAGRVGGVRGELLAHHRAGGRLRQAEVDADADAALEGVAVGEPLVRDAVQVPRLVREDGDRPRRSAGTTARGA